MFRSRTVVLAWMAASAGLLWGCLARGNPCETDADCPGGERCADAFCSGAQKPLPPAVCTDALEPNDRLVDARLLPVGTRAGLRVCAGDDDWFAIELAVHDALSARARFDALVPAGRVAMALHGPDGALLATASLENAETAFGDFRARDAGRHFVRVYVPGAATPPTSTSEPAKREVFAYDLTLSVRALVCTRRESISAERVVRARSPLPGASAIELGADAEAFYELSLGVADAVRVEARAIGDGGAAELELELYAYPTGTDDYRPLPAQVVRTREGAVLRYGPASRAEPVALRVVARDRALRFTLQVTNEKATRVRTGFIEGTARFEDRAVASTGLGPPTPAPIRVARVEVVRLADGYVIGQASTDAAGRFRARFESYSLASEDAQGAEVRVLATRADGFVGWEVLRSEECREGYAVSASVTSLGPATAVGSAPEPSSMTVDLLARAVDVGGAFNIYEVFGSAFDLIQRTGHRPRARTVVGFWERGVKYPCGSCQLGSAIFIGGGASDPDEYDDPVLAHEAGHFFEELWSHSDSSGGSHNGSRADPTLAWSEGFATFFSSLVRGSPLYVDTRDGEALVQDIEQHASRSSIGTSNMMMGGDVSEYLVSAVLWDLHDGPSAREPLDRAAHAAADMLAPNVDYFLSPDLRDRGVTGVDLVDWLDGWRCLDSRPDEELRPILEARAFPYDFAGPATCVAAPARKPSAAVTLALDARPEGPDGRVRVRASAVALDEADAFRMTLRLPAGWRLLAEESTPGLEAVLPAKAVSRAKGLGKPSRYDLIRMAPARGTALSLEYVVVPGDDPRSAMSVAAVLEGPSTRRSPMVRGWPEGVRRPLTPQGTRARAARSASGLPLVVFRGDSP